MPLDADRIAAALLEGCKALIAKEAATLRAENEALRARLEAVEGREIPAAFDASGIEAQVKALGDALAAIPEAQEIPEIPDVAGMLEAAVAASAAEQRAKAAEMVERAIAALPQPKDYDAEIRAVREVVEAVRSEIPALHEAPDLSGLATKAEVEAVREDIPAIPEAPDLSGFATKDEMYGSLEEVRSAIPGVPDLSDFATKAEIEAVRAAIPEAPDLSGFATKAEVEAVAAIQLPEPIAGKDGRGIADVKVNDDREVIVKFTDGETKNLGSFDGLGFDDLSVEDGEREFTVVFARGDQVKRFPLAKDVVIDRGIWKEGSGYVRGDGLTYAGDYWIAQEPTTSRPGTDKTWRLAVRKGRDAKPVTR